MEVYAKNLEDLMRKNLVYACSCSRKDVQAITQQQTGELTYPGTCRSRGLSFDKKNTALRLVMPDQPISFKDGLLGLITQNPATSGGDVMIRDRHGHWTYQFAVVVDDLDQDINLIIRGEDLLSSTGRQLVLRSYLRPDQPPPQFYHHPLIVDAQGQKLSKRLLSESIQSMRTRGSTADEVRGFVANLAGLTHSQKPITLGALPEVIKLPIKPT
jgi:glutamyl-tRNA synthetase/glutamyl-Q tRNA(Asp) synthetase